MSRYRGSFIAAWPREALPVLARTSDERDCKDFAVVSRIARLGECQEYLRWTTRRGLVHYSFESKNGKVDEDVPVGAEEAERGCKYVCPAGRAALVLRGRPEVSDTPRLTRTGRKRPRRHYAHRAGPRDYAFYGESRQHVVAKYLVHRAILRWLSGRGEPPKHLAGLECPHGPEEDKFPEAAARAKLERRIEREAGKIQPDVLVFDDSGGPILGVEDRWRGRRGWRGR